MAEREGFEPSIPVKVYTLSRRAVSTAHPPLRIRMISAAEAPSRAQAHGQAPYNLESGILCRKTLAVLNLFRLGRDNAVFTVRTVRAETGSVGGS